MSKAEATQVTKDNDIKTVYTYLMSHNTSLRNADALARMISSNANGKGGLPHWLGLDESEFNAMLQTYFPGAILSQYTPFRMDNEQERADEQSELCQLLEAHRADTKPDTQWIANIVVTGCMGGNHLWQDLGLWCRQDLTTMMETTFPELAGKNDKNMKWKKFLYKQLCIQEGIYTCRSPSCEICVDYKECFAPE